MTIDWFLGLVLAGAIITLLLHWIAKYGGDED